LFEDSIRHFRSFWASLLSCNRRTFKVVAFCLALLQTIVPVANVFGDSLSRPETGSYWVGKPESELTASWGLADGRINFSDGRSLITYQSGRMIGGPGFKMEKVKYLKDSYQFIISADGSVERFSTHYESGSSNSFLIFVAGMAFGVILFVAVLAISLRGSMTVTD